MSTILVSDTRFADHLMPPGHPERRERAEVMHQVALGWAAAGVPIVAPRPATREERLRVHDAAYVDRIEATAGHAVMLDPDSFTSPGTAAVAALAAGGTVAAVGHVLAAPAPARALVLPRPPGHHAERRRAMGFCLYNNVAIAAAAALATGVPRVAIVDFDVHHGNGTQWAFYDDPRVLFISAHQYPFYPGTGSAGEAGAGGGEGFTVNLPLDAGATDGDYGLVFDAVVLPVLRAFDAGLLLVSAGFDLHARDPLAGMRVSTAGAMALVARLLSLETAQRAVFVVEGGYHLRALAACIDGTLRQLTGLEGAPAPEAPRLDEDGGAPPAGETGRGRAAVALARAVHARYWPGVL